MSDATQITQEVSKKKVDVRHAVGKGIGVAASATTKAAKVSWSATASFFKGFSEGVKEGWAGQ